MLCDIGNVPVRNVLFVRAVDVADECFLDVELGLITRIVFYGTPASSHLRR